MRNCMYIELKNLEKKMGKKVILHNINLKMEGGKIYGLKGKNGCGKTMLMRAISGLIKPTSGEIIINDEKLWKNITFPRSIGILIENPAFINSATGFDNLKMIASIKGVASDKDIEDSLTKVGLEPYDTRRYRKYSLGMKQKLGIACAIMENPDIIILDEPINAIDREGVLAVRKILDDLKSQNKIIIIACHDAEEMEMLADEIYEMENGEIIEKRNNKI